MRRRTWTYYEHEYNRCYRHPGRCAGHTLRATPQHLDLINALKSAGLLATVGSASPTLRQRVCVCPTDPH